jgi:hypothetical protein
MATKTALRNTVISEPTRVILKLPVKASTECIVAASFWDWDTKKGFKYFLFKAVTLLDPKTLEFAVPKTCKEFTVRIIDPNITNKEAVDRHLQVVLSHKWENPTASTQMGWFEVSTKRDNCKHHTEGSYPNSDTKAVELEVLSYSSLAKKG